MIFENTFKLDAGLESIRELYLEHKNRNRRRAAEILLVEDDPGDVDLTIEILKRGKIKHNIVVVDDGARAIEYLLRFFKKNDVELNLPDLIILDLNLPKRDGRNVLQWIKANNKLKYIPVIVFTTSKAEPDIERCYLSGANCYISKPVDFSDFSNVVLAIEFLDEYRKHSATSFFDSEETFAKCKPCGASFAAASRGR